MYYDVIPRTVAHSTMFTVTPLLISAEMNTYFSCDTYSNSAVTHTLSAVPHLLSSAVTNVPIFAVPQFTYFHWYELVII